MLLQFKFANYRSFTDETIFNITATPIREHKKSLIVQNGVQALPVAAFYGANASGKSSFFLAIDAMCDLVIGSVTRDANERTLIKSSYNPFAFEDDYLKKPTEYEVCITIEGFEYRYGFEHTGERVLSEYLYKRKLSKSKTVEKVIFERREKRVISQANAELKKEVEYCASMIVEHSLLLTDLGRRGKIAEFGEIYNWFHNTVTSFRFGLDFRIENFFFEKVAGSLFNGKEPFEIELSANMLNLVNEMDDSIQAIKSVKKEGEYFLKSIHRYNGVEIEAPFSIESDGTKRLLSISYYIFIALSKGFCCFIDELDLRLHPLLLRKIVHMFKDKEINKKGAQLVFSAHNIINLDSSDLRRDEVWFIEKNDHKSSIFSLYDYEDEDNGDIRSDLDYGKHYLLGRFGAIPFQDRGGMR